MVLCSGPVLWVCAVGMCGEPVLWASMVALCYGLAFWACIIGLRYGLVLLAVGCSFYLEFSWFSFVDRKTGCSCDF